MVAATSTGVPRPLRAVTGRVPDSPSARTSLGADTVAVRTTTGIRTWWLRPVQVIAPRLKSLTGASAEATSRIRTRRDSPGSSVTTDGRTRAVTPGSPDTDAV